MPKRTVSFRLSDELIQKIEDLAKEAGRSRTSMLIEILTKGLSITRQGELGLLVNLVQHMRLIDYKVSQISRDFADFRDFVDIQALYSTPLTWMETSFLDASDNPLSENIETGQNPRSCSSNPESTYDIK